MGGTLHPVGDSPEEDTPGEGLGGSSHCVSNLVSLVSVADGRSSLSRLIWQFATSHPQRKLECFNRRRKTRATAKRRIVGRIGTYPC